jgi:quercetin dioxygenase-like cupin family protein
MSTGSLQSKRFEPPDEAGELVDFTGRRTYAPRTDAADCKGGRTMTKITLLGLALIAALAAAAPSLGAPPPVFSRALAVGTMQKTTLHAGAGAMIVDSITIQPGGSFGWHIHPAPVAVVVTGGTLTVLDPTVHGCAPFKVSKGQAFVEPANHVHLARNDGRTPATVVAMYLGVAKGAAANAARHAPAACKT